MSEPCCKFQIPASNIVGEDAETRAVLQSHMVQSPKYVMLFKGT